MAEFFQRKIKILILLIASSSLFSLSAAFAQSMDISIDQIEFEGVRVIDQSDVESSLEVDIGDPPDRSRILKTIQNIQNLYRGKGYDNVSIESRLIRRRLKSGKQICNCCRYRGEIFT